MNGRKSFKKKKNQCLNQREEKVNEKENNLKLKAKELEERERERERDCFNVKV